MLIDISLRMLHIKKQNPLQRPFVSGLQTGTSCYDNPFILLMFYFYLFICSDHTITTFFEFTLLYSKRKKVFTYDLILRFFFRSSFFLHYLMLMFAVLRETGLGKSFFGGVAQPEPLRNILRQVPNACIT